MPRDTTARRAQTVCAVALVLLGCLVLWRYVSTTPPTDAQLERAFVDHRADFRKLRDMILAEREFLAISDAGRIQYRDTKSNAVRGRGVNMSLEPFCSYRKLLDAAGAECVLRMSGSRVVKIRIFSCGLMMSGKTKSLVFWPSSDRAYPPPVVQSTDDCRGNGTWYKAIGEENWYIELSIY
jgi:hypothetical protein